MRLQSTLPSKSFAQLLCCRASLDLRIARGLLFNILLMTTTKLASITSEFSWSRDEFGAIPAEPKIVADDYAASTALNGIVLDFWGAGN